MHVLVTGATGAIGPTIVEHLAAAGHQVRVLIRSAAAISCLSPGIETVTGDITDREAVNLAVQGCQGIVHGAAVLHLRNPNAEQIDEMRAVNVEGTRNVVDAATRVGVRRVVFLSSITVYGVQPQILTESSPLSGETPYALSKIAAESIVLSARDRAGLPTGVVLRLAAVYGSRLKGNYRSLIAALRAGWFVNIGSCANRRSLIVDRDAARAIGTALENPAARGRIFNASDNVEHTVADIITAICQTLGRPRPRLSLSLALSRSMIRVADKTSRMFGRSSALEEQLEKFVEDVRVSSDLIREVLGFRCEYSLSRGWAEALKEWDRARDSERTHGVAGMIEYRRHP